ncbi:MAG: hypothetical protein JW955_25080 [Sedimentisphaerales bacterium]|nr:hypothetical protein [Sedimentisphaerales bacterium]
MSCPDLGTFWSESKQRIGEALPRGVAELAAVLQTGADAFGLTQELDGRYIHWKTREGKLALVFCIVPDPRDLDAVLDAYVHAKERQPALTALFVHQWTDGEGSWDAFIITPQRAMQHADRIGGSDVVEERGPALREDIYEMFTCGRDLPGPGQAEWAELLAGPIERVTDQLGALAASHGCTQTVSDHVVQWLNAEGQPETQFFVLPDPEEIGAYVSMYRQIRQTHCPISFVFIKGDEPRLYDIFRLSARSYLEHHNQLRGRLRLKVTNKGKLLEGLRWSPRWASHVGCIKGCLNYLKREVSDAWLFGATGHAFVLNISPGLCPSGPTDWDTSGFLRLGRNVGYRVESVDQYCPQKRNLRDAQERAWDHVRRSIDDGLPCYGWEIDGPEYYVIYGYDETGYYISGPGCDDGAGPIPWRNLGESEIGVVLVANVQRTEPADARHTVRDALSLAVDLGRNRWKWTDRAGGLDGYAVWIETMKEGRADRFGLGYNAAVWAESRKFAVEFLLEARQQLQEDTHSLFDKAVAHYEAVARNLKSVSDAYPFTECESAGVRLDDRALAAAQALTEACQAEATGLDVLAEIVARLASESGH